MAAFAVRIPDSNAQTGTDNLEQEQLNNALLYLVLRLANAERALLEAYEEFLE